MLDLDKIVRKSLKHLNYDEEKYSIRECAYNVYLDEDYDCLRAQMLEERHKNDMLVNSLSKRLTIDEV